VSSVVEKIAHHDHVFELERESGRRSSGRIDGSSVPAWSQLAAGIIWTPFEWGGSPEQG
jgi:hypothetical protein